MQRGGVDPGGEALVRHMGHVDAAAAEELRGETALGKESKGDPNTWKIVDGKLCLDHSAAVHAKGESDPATIPRAHQNWAAGK